ncbi:unnamed protein product [Closterium sp. NIES-53]
MNVFFYANYVSKDSANIRYAVLLLRGPTLDWWRIIVTKPTDYLTLPTREGQTGPWAPSHFVEVPQYRTWDAWCVGLRARFEPIAASIAARQRLRTLRQLGSVHDSTSRFLALCEQVGYMHEGERIDCYIGGLKHEIAWEIQLRNVTEFNEILAMAENLDFLRRPRSGTATSATARPQDRTRSGGTADSTATVPTDPTRTGRTKEAAGLPSRERVHSPEFVTLRSIDTIHTEKRRGISHVHRLPRTEPSYHQVPLPHPASRRTDQPTLHCLGLLENRPSRRLPPDPRQPTQLPENNFSKTTFRTHYRSFKYTVMPFGLTNAPATFKMTMNEAFRPLLDKCVNVYLDDTLIYSPNRAQHLQDIEAVFKILSESRMLTKSVKV